MPDQKWAIITEAQSLFTIAWARLSLFPPSPTVALAESAPRRSWRC